MTTDNFCFHLQNRLIQTSQTEGQRYSDTFLFIIPWRNYQSILNKGGETSHPYIVVSNPMQEILECEIKNYLIFGESQTSRFGQKIRLELRQNFFLFVLKVLYQKQQLIVLTKSREQ